MLHVNSDTYNTQSFVIEAIGHEPHKRVNCVCLRPHLSSIIGWRLLGQVTSLILKHSGRDSFCVKSHFDFWGWVGSGGVNVLKKWWFKVPSSTPHRWLLLLNSKEPCCQASSFLFAFMSTVWVLGLSCRQVFWYYRSLFILVFGEMRERAVILLF